MPSIYILLKEIKLHLLILFLESLKVGSMLKNHLAILFNVPESTIVSEVCNLIKDQWQIYIPAFRYFQRVAPYRNKQCKE